MNKIKGHERTLYRLFSLIEQGHLVVRNHQGKEFHFGQQDAPPDFRLCINNPKTYERLISFGTLGFGESYIDGWLDEADNKLMGLIGLFLDNGLNQKVSRNLALTAQLLFQRVLTTPRRIQNSRKNVAFHYDIGNDFYKLFLDKSLTYSCGYQLTPDDSLEAMQRQKYQLIAQKLSLKKEDRIVDIGCGWGGMLIYAAQEYGVSGLGITLSQEQARLASQRIEDMGLSHHIEVKVLDYRELQGQYDKLVSIGMFEHVGKGNYATFMQKTAELLQPEGIGLLHTVGTIGRLGNGPLVQKYFFPGGYLPKLHQIMEPMWAAGLNIAHCENLKPHYAETLRHWSANFQANQEKIKALSGLYDDRFLRMWNLYLQIFEASFRYGNIQLFQILFQKGRNWQFNTPLDFQIDT